MRSRPRFRQQAKIPYRPELRHLALVAVCAKRLIRHPVLALSLASSCAAGLTDSSTCICILHIRTWASSALSPGIDDQSASASHARECLRHRHVGGSCLLGESSCRHQCSYCPYLSAFMHAHTVQMHTSSMPIYIWILSCVTSHSRSGVPFFRQHARFMASSWKQRIQPLLVTKTRDEKQPAMGRF